MNRWAADEMDLRGERLEDYEDEPETDADEFYEPQSNFIDLGRI